MRLLRANPYRGFGDRMHPGKTHVLKDHPNIFGEQCTLCGKTTESCPGKITKGSLEEINCKTCRNSIESAARRALYEAQAQERVQEQRELNQRWWAAYNQYLQSPTWLEKRRMVLHLSGGICEGCANAKAVQVHHREYPRGCLPGSPEWIRREKLFFLVALCIQCHNDLHEFQT